MDAPCQPPATKPSHLAARLGLHQRAQAPQETCLRPPAFLPGGNREALVPPPHRLIGESTQWCGSSSPQVLAWSQKRLGMPQSSLA